MTIQRGVITIGLWFVFMFSALSVVYVTHKARVSTHELELLRHEEADLNVESGQLLLEKSSLATFVRVERLAVEKLGMRVPKTEQVMIVKP